VLTKQRVREFLKCSNDYKYFRNNYLIQDNNSEALTFICWILLCKSNKTIIYLIKDLKNGEQLIITLYRFLENLPRWIKPIFIEKNKSGFTLENGNRFCVVSKRNKSRDIRFDYVVVNSFSIIDEYKDDLKLSMKKPINNLNRRIIYLI